MLQRYQIDGLPLMNESHLIIPSEFGELENDSQQ